ncbi:FAD binding domain protein [Patellaria atrata CBS 101060]|uniref:FAD binding domain protein n=1 Tax=Patellaria atrata CBS 101060 TaxID=1346257 RepID=A0A9P4SI11_9PEZI|nr:FAD binding domain protein [Patellaria atrata CBS 101060]
MHFRNLLILSFSILSRASPIETSVEVGEYGDLSKRGVQQCAIVCAALEVLYPSKTLYQTDAAYATDQIAWPQQNIQLQPKCRFKPKSAKEVSVAVIAARKANCFFAVKSGGHMPIKGASNIQDGLTIDLKDLDSLSLTNGNKIVQIGAGALWGEVYAYLNPKGLGVTGGRLSNIGAGGFILGGGISFTSNKYGWACDNVKSYEIVLGSGDIVTASASSNPDLFRALRGGGNNFGIVTRFDMETHPEGNMWGGMIQNLPTSKDKLYEALYWFNKNAPKDNKAGVIIASVGVPSLGGIIFANDYEYLDPTPNPPIFDNFTAETQIGNTMRVGTYGDFAAELNAPVFSGLRQNFFTLVFKNDARLPTDIWDFWAQKSQPFLDGSDPGFLATLAMQPITESMLALMAKNGGNSLGLGSRKGPFIIINLGYTWSSPTSDNVFNALGAEVINFGKKLAQQRGLWDEFLYHNYADISQNPFDSYGAANKAQLVKTQRKFDPSGVFSKLVVGGHKLR